MFAVWIPELLLYTSQSAFITVQTGCQLLFFNVSYFVLMILNLVPMHNATPESMSSIS